MQLSYDTLETPLMKQVQKLSNRGWIAVHGLEVLPEQGIAQFELFTGRRAPVNVMRSQVTRRVTELAQ
jgi:shikimate 5-dehydrogenase